MTLKGREFIHAQYAQVVSAAIEDTFNKNIVLLDPNMFACKDWKNLSQQLIDSKAWVNFSQGCDIRIMTEEKAEYIKRMKIKQIHFAWDRYQDKDNIVPKFKMFQNLTGTEGK